MRFEKFSFLNMCSMNFIKLPAVAISLKTSYILNLWVNWIHVLQAPQPSAHGLCNWKYFKIKSSTRRLFQQWKKYRKQGEPDGLIISTLMLRNVWYAQMIAAIPLIQETIYSSVKLAQLARLCIKLKRNIKCCISRCFN